MREPTGDFSSLHQLLDHIASRAEGQERVSLDLIVQAVGQRSFAPLLLLVGIILFSPLSAIPGVPTMMAILVLLVALQLLLGRHYFWLPQWMLKHSISEAKLLKALNWLQKPARFTDRWLRPRMVFLVRRTGTYVIAAICTLIALVLPAMEVIPLSATIAGMALTAFGLALVTHDGALALFAFAVTAFVFGLIIGTLG